MMFAMWSIFTAESSGFLTYQRRNILKFRRNFPLPSILKKQEKIFLLFSYNIYEKKFILTASDNLIAKMAVREDQSPKFLS
jgi:hypothetical protein